VIKEKGMYETIVIIPLTSQIHDYPWRMSFKLEDKTAEAALDQIKTIDKRRIKDFIGKLSDEEIEILKTKIKEMFVD
jgi:mRNA interferase MazF